MNGGNSKKKLCVFLSNTKRLLSVSKKRN